MTRGPHLQVLQPSFLRSPLDSEDAERLEETSGFHVEIEGLQQDFPRIPYITVLLRYYSGRDMQGKLAQRTKDLTYDWPNTYQTPSRGPPEFLQINPVKIERSLSKFSLGI